MLLSRDNVFAEDITGQAVNYSVIGYHPTVGTLQVGYMPRKGLVRLYVCDGTGNTFELLGWAGKGKSTSVLRARRHILTCEAEHRVLELQDKNGMGSRVRAGQSAFNRTYGIHGALERVVDFRPEQVALIDPDSLSRDSRWCGSPGHCIFLKYLPRNWPFVEVRAAPHRSIVDCRLHPGVPAEHRPHTQCEAAAQCRIQPNRMRAALCAHHVL